MAGTLSPLATVADMEARNITVSDSSLAETFLASASASIRDAAGVPISAGEWTITLAGYRDPKLALPGQPVTGVSGVLLDGQTITDWRFVAGDVWRVQGWQTDPVIPGVVVVTMTAGIDPVPDDIVTMTCSLAAYGLSLAQDGDYSSRGDLFGVRIDDYQEQYIADAALRTADPMELPPATRAMLAARFSGSAAVVRAR